MGLGIYQASVNCPPVFDSMVPSLIGLLKDLSSSAIAENFTISFYQPRTQANSYTAPISLITHEMSSSTNLFPIILALLLALALALVDHPSLVQNPNFREPLHIASLTSMTDTQAHESPVRELSGSYRTRCVGWRCKQEWRF